MSPAKTFEVTWAQVHEDARLLAERLKDAGPWTGIVAITRGGLVPAAIVARDMNVRMIETLCITSYTGRIQEEVQVLKPPLRALDDGAGGKGWLMIDDLVDTGATARMARTILPKAHFATLCAKPDGRPLVDTFLHPVEQNVWVSFPWDVNEGESLFD